MNQPSSTPFSGSDLRYPSAASLRVAHEALVKLRREEGDTLEILAEIQSLLRDGCDTGRLLEREDERRASQAILDFWSNVLLRLGRDPGDATLQELDPSLAPELPDKSCPYVGLDAFSEETSDWFFGRQRLVQTLIERVAADRLVVVSGPSGSGKSSVVLAGLIPALKAGAIPGSQNWYYLPRIVPGSDPLANLARLLSKIAVNPAADPDTWVKDQVNQLRRDPGTLARLALASGESPVIGVIDQFEEVFTLCADGVTRQAFVSNLLNLVRSPGPRHTIILTVRSDFESRLVLLPDFQAEFDRAVIRVTPVDASELREAIERPAALVGLRFEGGPVVDALLNDILGEPAGLPLLQFSLLKLWDMRQRNLVTWDAYKELGGGRLALAKSADAFYYGLIPEDQFATRRILLRLVRPTEGFEVTSNRVRLETLLQAGGTEHVLKKLFSARLLRVTEGDVAADTQVEIAHEALTRNWPLLVEWLDEERALLRKRVRLTSAAEQWEAVGRSKDALWGGALLKEAQDYSDLSNLERAFLAAGQLAEEEELHAKEEVRLLELANAKRIAQLERDRAAEAEATSKRMWKRNLVLGFLALLLGVAAIIAVSAFVVASSQTAAAEVARSTAEAARSTAEAGATRVVEKQNQLATAEVQQTRSASSICYNTVVDGGFENQLGWWNLGGGPLPPAYVTSPVHTGQWAMTLGNVGQSSNVQAYSHIRQTVTIPANTLSSEVSFWVWTMTEPNPGEDRQELILTVPGASVTSSSIPIWSELSNSSGFRNILVSANTQIGRTFDLVFSVYNDGFGGRTSMVIDDVALYVCSAAALEPDMTSTPESPTRFP